MGEENQPSKKRAAGRELTRENHGLDDDENVEETEMGTFKKASDDVLATRKIVKVRRQQTSTAPSGPTSNPFAGIRLVAPMPSAPVPAPTSASAPVPAPTSAPVNASEEAQAVEGKEAVDDPETKDDATTEPEVTNTDSEEKLAPEQPPEVEQLDQVVGDMAENVVDAKTADELDNDGSTVKTNGAELADEKQVVDDDKANENGKTEDSSGTPWKSLQQLSSTQNAFTGVSGTGFSSSAFSFGSIQRDGSPSQPSVPSFSFVTSTNGSTPLFGTIGTGSSIGGKTEGNAFSAMKELPRETGEENEETVFSADSILFEFIENVWKERGKGEVKVNVCKGENQKARLVMRTKGNLRLILNASLYPDLKLTKMEKKGITFACVNSVNEVKDSLSTFALKFKDGSIVEEFTSVVSTHKGKPATTLKTPENSPKATED